MPQLPGVEAMMAKDEASRGLGIELIHQGEERAGLYDVTVRRGGEVIAEFRGRSHELGPAS